MPVPNWLLWPLMFFAGSGFSYWLSFAVKMWRDRRAGRAG